ncbi:hypothetical protein GC209_03850 [bacterium]|nr:hypothetical protein [bacterium]
MNLIRLIWDELIGMFIDDGALATQVALLVALVTLAVKVAQVPPLWAASLLIPGCVAILGASVMRAARKG